MTKSQSFLRSLFTLSLSSSSSSSFLSYFFFSSSPSLAFLWFPAFPHLSLPYPFIPSFLPSLPFFSDLTIFCVSSTSRPTEI
ncbi:hypothetical protein BKA57DRAFT_471219, partial [Linnemannia elongata]